MGSNPAGTTKILIVGREDDGSGLLIHRSESSNIGSNPILSAKYKGQKLVWYSGGLLNRGEWDRYPPGPQKKYGKYQPILIRWRTVVGMLKTWVRVPPCRQKSLVSIEGDAPDL